MTSHLFNGAICVNDVAFDLILVSCLVLVAFLVLCPSIGHRVGVSVSAISISAIE